MTINDQANTTIERTIAPIPGLPILISGLAVVLLSSYWTVWIVRQFLERTGEGSWVMFSLSVLITSLAIFVLCGFYTLQPNEARILILFGSYKGTVRGSGFFWANPLLSRNRGNAPADVKRSGGSASGLKPITDALFPNKLSTKMSLRAHNFTSDKLKVNDQRGSPIEIAAVVVWRITDTAKAAFDVEDYESYIHIQSEAAIRHLANLYPYDSAEGKEATTTLRDSGDIVAKELEKELEVRLARAGVSVQEARFTHLAYAPEIAQSLLRRQQAEAIIAARSKIVQGAVSMVEEALTAITQRNFVELDNERRATMVSNLLVVLCGDSEVSPVINTGTLYT